MQTTAHSRHHRVAVMTGSRSGERFYESSPWIIRALLDVGHQVTGYALDDARLASHLLRWHPEVVWPTGLGSNAEDGTLAGFLETLLPDTPAVGFSVRASALAMDKEASKDAFRTLGLAVPDGVCFLPQLTPYGWAFHVSKPADASCLTPEGQPDFYRLVERLGLPLVVKPCSAGASLGLALVREADTLVRVLLPTAARYGPLLVEEYIASHCPEGEVEYSVCLLEGAEPLPVFEVRATRYDTAHKIAGAAYQPISGELAERLQACAWAIFAYLGCRGFARMDARVTPQDVLYPLEINTNPGLIPGVSIFPQACAASGLTYRQMIARILASAFLPHRRAEPPVAAHDAPPFPAAFQPLLPDLPAESQTPGFYHPIADAERSISIAHYRC